MSVNNVRRDTILTPKEFVLRSINIADSSIKTQASVKAVMMVIQF